MGIHSAQASQANFTYLVGPVHGAMAKLYPSCLLSGRARMLWQGQQQRAAEQAPSVRVGREVFD
jgi:hypothetical protein